MSNPPRSPSDLNADFQADGAVAPSTVLRQLGRVPNRALSQSFLREPAIARAMVEAASLQPGESVLEIGPGLGMLTRELVLAGACIVAVELDRDLAGRLSDLIGMPPGLRVVQGDILNVNLADLIAEPFTVVASLPYHIATAVLFRLAFQTPRPERIVVLVQREVGERIVLNPRRPSSYLGMALAVAAEARLVRPVSRGCFYPVPKVDSAVIRLDIRSCPLGGPDDLQPLLEFLRAGFTQPRKQLHNSLGQGLGIAPASLQVRIREAGIDSERRPGALSSTEWLSLYQALAVA